MTTLTRAETRPDAKAKAGIRKSGRLKNGIGAGSYVRVYRKHEMRFARVSHVISRVGVGANVTLQYLDYDQEEAKVYGSVIQPVTRGWIVDMKDRFGYVKKLFEPSINGPYRAQEEPGARKLASGATQGSLIRIYRDYHLRFGRLLSIDKVGIPSMPNVRIEYIDGPDDENGEDKVFGNIVQPFTQAWVEDMESRLEAISKLMVAERAMELNAKMYGQ